MKAEAPQEAFTPAPTTLPCPKCGEFMPMSRLVMEIPGRDQRTFECRRCAVQEVVAVRYRPIPPRFKE